MTNTTKNPNMSGQMLRTQTNDTLFGNRSGVKLTPMATRYILYARKSSQAEDKQAASIESQVNEMQKLAQKRGFEVVATLSEAQSAKNPGRQVFNQLLATIYAKQADGILCWKLDRLARNPIDGGNIIWMLQQGLIATIATIEGDHNCQDNMLMLYMRFGMAGQYSLDLSKDTKRGQWNKTLNGWMPGFAPPGYLNEKHADKGTKRILPDPDQWDKVKELWRYFLKTEATNKELLFYGRKIGIKGKNKGDRLLVQTTLHRLLRNPFYAGEFRWRGELHPGNHKPMITKAQFNQGQEILNRRHPYRKQTKHQFKYRGMIRCGECGAMITAEAHTTVNPKATKLIYYRCTRRLDPSCSQKAIREELLEVQLKPLLAKRGIMDAMTSGRMELRMVNQKVRAFKALPTDPSVGSRGFGLNRTLSALSTPVIRYVTRLLNDI